VVAAIALGACSVQQKHAQTAISDIEASVQAAGPDAQRYAPKQLATVKTKLDTLKASLQEKDYPYVISNAPAVLASAEGLPSIIATKKAQELAALKTRWSELAAAVPHEIEAIHHRIGLLEKTRHLPRGIDKKELATAEASFKDAKGTWAMATSDFAGGNVSTAVEKARMAQKEATTLMSELKMEGKSTSHS